jgi:hypothetical protein
MSFPRNQQEGIVNGGAIVQNCHHGLCDTNGIPVLHNVSPIDESLGALVEDSNGSFEKSPIRNTASSAANKHWEIASGLDDKVVVLNI